MQVSKARAEGSNRQLSAAWLRGAGGTGGRFQGGQGAGEAMGRGPEARGGRVGGEIRKGGACCGNVEVVGKGAGGEKTRRGSGVQQHHGGAGGRLQHRWAGRGGHTNQAATWMGGLGRRKMLNRRGGESMTFLLWRWQRGTVGGCWGQAAGGGRHGRDSGCMPHRELRQGPGGRCLATAAAGEWKGTCELEFVRIRHPLIPNID